MQWLAAAFPFHSLSHLIYTTTTTHCADETQLAKINIIGLLFELLDDLTVYL